MYRPAQKHPLSSFRFWFLVLGCVAATTAWRMGWLPRSGAPQTAQSPATEEIDLPDAALGAPADDPRAAEFAAVLASAQHEPAETEAPRPKQPQSKGAKPKAQKPKPKQTASAPVEATDLWAGAATTQPESATPPARGAAAGKAGPGSPFGPANLEFVPADTFARKPETGAATAGTAAQRFPADPGMITQVAGTDAAEAQVTAAAILTGEPPVEFIDPQPAPEVDWAAIDRMINDGQDVEAHRLLSTLYWERPELREKVRERIEQTAMRIYFLPQPHYIEPYVVQGGDLLQNVARNYNVSWQYLAKLNRTDPIRIRPGQKLKVIQGPFGAVVDLRRFELTVHANGYFVARFPIGIGKDGSTPVGEFSVQDKLENPTYYGPDGVIAADDAQNPLGEYWLSIGDSYGIHGTIDESSIGRAESRGCLRLKNQDIADLYDLLTVGSAVVIRR